jgi:hypothetical protein
MQQKYQSNNPYTQIKILNFSPIFYDYSYGQSSDSVGYHLYPFYIPISYFSKSYSNVRFPPMITSLKLSASYSFSTQYFYDLLVRSMRPRHISHISLSGLIILIALRAGLRKI